MLRRRKSDPGQLRHSLFSAAAADKCLSLDFNESFMEDPSSSDSSSDEGDAPPPEKTPRPGDTSPKKPFNPRRTPRKKTADRMELRKTPPPPLVSSESFPQPGKRSAAINPRVPYPGDGRNKISRQLILPSIKTQMMTTMSKMPDVSPETSPKSDAEGTKSPSTKTMMMEKLSSMPRVTPKSDSQPALGEKSAPNRSAHLSGSAPPPPPNTHT